MDPCHWPLVTFLSSVTLVVLPWGGVSRICPLCSNTVLHLLDIPRKHVDLGCQGRSQEHGHFLVGDLGQSLDGTKPFLSLLKKTHFPVWLSKDQMSGLFSAVVSLSVRLPEASEAVFSMN